MSESNKRPGLSTSLTRELHTIEHKYLMRIVAFLALYTLGAFTATTLFAWVGGSWQGFLICLPLYILTAASLHGISLFTHEGVHGVLFKNRFLNHALSAACALPVLQNFAAYRVLHLRHHKHTGEEGDPDHYKNYTEQSWLVFAMHWGRLLLGYPAYITAIPVLGFIQGKAKDRFWILVEVGLLALLIWGVWISPIPRTYLLHGWLIPMLFINTMVNIRGMSQHTLLEHATDVIQGTRTIVTNPVTTYFMCNENYHLEHHLYPAVPWYHLPRLHQELRPELEKKGAPFISSYWAFVWQFITATTLRRKVGTVSLKDL